MQLFSLRVARINEQQTTAAGLMYIWHSGAYKYAKEHVNVDAMTDGTSCLISPVSGTQCDDRISPPSKATLTVNNDAQGQYLPTGFNVGFVGTQFISHVYKTSADKKFIITYVYNGGTAMGVNAGQMMEQIKRLDRHVVTYGGVRSATKCDNAMIPGTILETSTFLSGKGSTQIKSCFDIQSTIPDGSVGLVSYL